MTVVLPSTLTGVSNGQVPADKLSPIGVGNAVMEYTAARAFRAMFALARLAGFVIREVGDYRSYQEQLSLFLSRYRPVSLTEYQATPTAHRKYWAQARSLGYTSQYWIKKNFSLATAAVPGSSNHGWGLALDIAEETDGDPGPEGITPAFVSWLVANARKFGISAELQSEAWHWRYCTGDAVPAAVIAYEQGTPPPDPTPPPPTTGDVPIVVTANMTKVQQGSTGADVKRLQAILLHVFGQTSQITVVDGIFGPKTKEAVMNAQRILQGGYPTLVVDGIVGPMTWQAILQDP